MNPKKQRIAKVVITGMMMSTGALSLVPQNVSEAASVPSGTVVNLSPTYMTNNNAVPANPATDGFDARMSYRPYMSWDVTEGVNAKTSPFNTDRTADLKYEISYLHPDQCGNPIDYKYPMNTVLQTSDNNHADDYYTFTNGGIYMARYFVEDAAGNVISEKRTEINIPSCSIEFSAPLYGKIYHDDNRNGQDDDNNVDRFPNMTVQALDDMGRVVGSAVTDERGEYVINGLPGGVYTMHFEVPMGYTGTMPNDYKITKNHDTDTRDVNFGVDDSLSIGDRVWIDDNENGIVDGNENGVEGIKVTLQKNDGTVVSTTTTDQNGLYIYSPSNLQVIIL